MIAWWQRVSSRPVVAHLLRAGERFGSRLGSQFAAGIAYFSVVSLVPILMLCFSALGLAMTVFFPRALTDIEKFVQDSLSGQKQMAGDQILDVVTGALHNWAAIGSTGLIVALWIGGNWIGNLKRAIRVQLRPELGTPEKRLIWPLDVLSNLGMLLVMLVGIIVTSAAIPLTSMIGSDTVAALGLPAWLGTWALKVVSLVVSLAAGAGLFWMLLRLCAVDPMPHRAVLIGSLIGSVGLAALQFVVAYLIVVFSRNASSALFGPAIVLMLFLNLFATLILLVAAWVGTWQPPGQKAGEEDEAALVEPEPDEVLADGRIRPEVAEHALRAGLGAGYVVGAATGVGLGALVVRMLRNKAR